jgi:HEPN domain-containing protein
MKFRKLAQSRLAEARILLSNRKYDGAAYLCGYAIELILKSRICRNLGWSIYLVSRNYESFKTHNLEVLINLSGRLQKIHPKWAAEWGQFQHWNPNQRYDAVGNTKMVQAQAMIEAAEKLLKIL